MGQERAGGAEGLNIHCLNWAGASLFHLGEWDRVLEAFGEAVAAMGGRADDPPYFMMNLFGAAAFVHEARGLEGADRLLTILRDSRGFVHGGRGLASNWLAWAVESMTMRPFQDQVAAELFALTARWDEVPAFLGDARAYAKAAELLALPVHLDRLQGQHPLPPRPAH